MRNLSGFIHVTGAAALTLVIGAWSTTLVAACLRWFEVRDSIEVAQFTEPGIFSPDGRYFVTVTQRGVLPQGVTEGTIWLFDVSSVRQQILKSRPAAAVMPTVLARLSASINGDGGESSFGRIIMRLMWEPGSNSLLFLGRDGREDRQLFHVGLIDRNATALTPSTQDVVDYVEARNRIVCFAGPDVPRRNSGGRTTLPRLTSWSGPDSHSGICFGLIPNE